MKNRKKSKYPGIDISTVSALVNDIIAKLPKGHNWGSVYISKDKIGNAICINCGCKICYAEKYFSSNWVIYPENYNLNLNYDIISCEEYKMSQALE